MVFDELRHGASIELTATKRQLCSQALAASGDSILAARRSRTRTLGDVGANRSTAWRGWLGQIRRFRLLPRRPLRSHLSHTHTQKHQNRTATCFLRHSLFLAFDQVPYSAGNSRVGSSPEPLPNPDMIEREQEQRVRARTRGARTRANLNFDCKIGRMSNSCGLIARSDTS